MIYLERELQEFVQTKKEFAAAYVALLEEMHRLFQEKGKIRDIGSPFHHRQAPSTTLALAGMKVGRAETTLSEEGWTQDPSALLRIIEECIDAANFLVYVAALCSMLLGEEKGQ